MLNTNNNNESILPTMFTVTCIILAILIMLFGIFTLKQTNKFNSKGKYSKTALLPLKPSLVLSPTIVNAMLVGDNTHKSIKSFLNNFLTFDYSRRTLDHHGLSPYMIFQCSTITDEHSHTILERSSVTDELPISQTNILASFSNVRLSQTNIRELQTNALFLFITIKNSFFNPKTLILWLIM